jgi:hypothetical protein
MLISKKILRYGYQLRKVVLAYFFIIFSFYDATPSVADGCAWKG